MEHELLVHPDLLIKLPVEHKIQTDSIPRQNPVLARDRCFGTGGFTHQVLPGNACCWSVLWGLKKSEEAERSPGISSRNGLVPPMVQADSTRVISIMIQDHFVAPQVEGRSASTFSRNVSGNPVVCRRSDYPPFQSVL